MRSDKYYQALIHTSKWQRLRRWKLKEHPMCELCEQKGRTTLATEVHHVTPVEFGLNNDQKKELMFNAGNLMSLCHQCHVELHTTMGRSGSKRLKEMTKVQLNEFKRKYLTPSNHQPDPGGVF